MNYGIRKGLVVAGMLFAGYAAALVGVRAQNAPAGPGAGTAPKTASQQFKNIQVLKDAPADQIIPAMQFISASLGVDCEYCHVERAFDKDDKKPKVTARKMMEMMLTINSENFEGHREVTCNTCHQGAVKPASIPAISLEAKTPEMMAEAATGKTMSPTGNPPADSLLEGYLAAVGGAEALRKITSRVAKGNVTTSEGRTMTVDIYAEAPDKRVSVMHMKEGDSVTAYNGQVGWLSIPQRVHMMNAQESSGARMDADFAFAADVKAMYTKWETRAGEKIDGHETWLVVGRKEGEPPLRLYLDQKSGLLLRLVRYIDSPLGYNPTQIDYADYRATDGIKIPYRWTVARPGNHFTVQVEQLQQNVALDDARFVPPPPTAPPGGAAAH